MERESSTANRRRKKTLIACVKCRNRKIKCSGQDPCQYCLSKGVSCVFEERPKRVVISEEYLLELEGRASAVRDSASSLPSPVSTRRPLLSPNEHHGQLLRSPVSPSRRQEVPVPQLSSEHVNINSQTYAAESQHAIGDEFRRLGHSSSWSFSRRIRNMINESTGGSSLHDATPIRDGAYGIPWKTPVINLQRSELPTEDYSVYLTHTVSFTLGSLYCLFDQEIFLQRLHQFYNNDSLEHQNENDLWVVEMLVVLALGTSILAREAGPSGPAGAKYFASAVASLPHVHSLYQDPVLAVEILVMFALFMQAMDLRLAAYDYIGQAARISLVHGFNRVFDANRITSYEFEHRSKLWWTIYIIDRKLSSLIGVPLSVPDADISLTRPPINIVSSRDSTFSFHVELSSQLGQILNVVYGLGEERRLGGKFVSAIQSILHRLAETSVLLDKDMKIESQQSINNASRDAATLHLLHHQCSILAIRPVLFYLFDAKLRNGNGILNLSDAVIGLLRVCVESSLQILKIAETLRAQKLVDLLFPGDLDAFFMSCLCLIMVDIITPAATEQWDLNRTISLMDDMLLRGITTAGPYKKDLVELKELGQKFKSTHNGHLPCEQESSTVIGAVSCDSANLQQDFQIDLQTEQNLIWSWPAMNGDAPEMLHSNTIQSAIDVLNTDFLNDSTLQIDGSDWMWGSGTLNWPDGS